jgi:GTPase SAR1 family protein
LSSPSLIELLDALLEELRSVTAPEAVEAAARAADRIERDLRPRALGADHCVVCGLVGPNNAGKSALFNALMGREVSPSEATGGATRRLVGGASAEVCERLLTTGQLQRFSFEAHEAERRVEAALTPPEDPSRVVLVPSEHVPSGLLLIDTPDFDSVALDNRRSSEALLAVCDLVIAVVTRHTYQNAEVVSMLRRWLRRGRPWMLVINEAPSVEMAEEWVARLSQDVGSAPLASFHAPLDLEVMSGSKALAPRGLGSHAGLELATALGHLDELESLKQQALEASLAQLRGDLAEVGQLESRRSRAVGALLEAVEQRVRRAARRIASGGMPAGPFLSAFRAVLDRRSHPVSKTWRGGLRFMRLKLEALAARVRPGAAERASKAGVDPQLAQLERAELERSWPELFADIERWSSAAIAPGSAPQWTAGERAVAELPEDLRSRWSALTHAGPHPGLARAQGALESLPWSSERFQVACEELIEGAIEKRGFDWDIQAGADLATALPVALAAVLVVHTGGFAADLGVAGGGLLTSFLFERYTHVLGSGILREARARWEAERSNAVTDALLDAWFGADLERWRSIAAGGDAGARRLEGLISRIEAALLADTETRE